MRILIVEDDLNQNKALCQVLKKYLSAETVSAHDGVDMLEILQTDSIDLVLADIGLPTLDGASATKIARKNFKLKIPFIGITGLPLDSLLCKRGVGVFSMVIRKPIHINELLDDIETICTEEKEKRDEERHIRAEKKRNRNDEFW